MCVRVVGCVASEQCRCLQVDGRYPHWVAPHAEGSERYSLIFYQTEGAPLRPVHPLHPTVAFHNVIMLARFGCAHAHHPAGQLVWSAHVCCEHLTAHSWSRHADGGRAGGVLGPDGLGGVRARHECARTPTENDHGRVIRAE